MQPPDIGLLSLFGYWFRQATLNTATENGLHNLRGPAEHLCLLIWPRYQHLMESVDLHRTLELQRPKEAGQLFRDRQKWPL